MPRARRNGTRVTVVSSFALAALACLFLSPVDPAAQQSSSQPSPTQSTSAGSASASAPSPQNTPEMTSRDSVATFQVNVRLVEVRVVVRDSKGKAVGNLHKEDFKLLDNGKPQVITEFSVEQPGLRVEQEQKTSEAAATSQSPPVAANVPERYVAYLFDDIHMSFPDLIRVSQAADKNLDTLRPTDRAAIYTISGQGGLEFTDDHARLRDALRRVTPHPMWGRKDCPSSLTYYLADAIVNRDDPQASQVVFQDIWNCRYRGDPYATKAAQNDTKVEARRALAVGDAETNLTLASITNVVRRMLAVPGQRTILLASSGFITPTREYDVYSIIDRAANGNIVINILDARGLYVVIAGGDASQEGFSDPQIAGLAAQYQLASASADADVLANLSYGTGGYFFHNNNDLDAGFTRLASAPEYCYVLAFSPQNLKVDGHFHQLKVTVNGSHGYSIQARKGYFAPKQLSDPDKVTKEEIADALFSQEEMRDLPVDLHTQFFKPTDEQAKLTVLAHIDVRQLHFRKAEGRNNDNLTIVSGIFDANGNFVTANEKVLQMRLKDETLANNLGSGVSLKSDFDLKPGSYLVRLVVRDEHGQMAAESGAVRIP